MAVPVDDIVCRFIRPQDWSATSSKPKQGLMKQPIQSVWHEEKLVPHGANVSDLRIESLAGSGHFSLSVREYKDIASSVSSRITDAEKFEIEIEWRPEDEFVKEPWRQWRDAHAQLEKIADCQSNFPIEFRKLVIIMAGRKGSIVPPELDDDGT